MCTVVMSNIIFQLTNAVGLHLLFCILVYSALLCILTGGSSSSWFSLRTLHLGYGGIPVMGGVCIVYIAVCVFGSKVIHILPLRLYSN